jgi:hypothetical protein
MTRYRVPTHLDVEPSLIRAELGPIPVDLTFRQAAGLAGAAAVAYWLWQGSGLPFVLTIAATLAVAVATLIAAFVSIGGRSADLWLRDALHYAVRPRRLAWLPDDLSPAGEASAGAWTDAPLHLAWEPVAGGGASASLSLGAD